MSRGSAGASPAAGNSRRGGIDDPWSIADYKLRQVIARGRHSVVYRASRGDADVALKVSPFVDFGAEHRLLQQLSGDHVIRPEAHGRSQAGFWLALELAPGGSLATARRGASDDATVAHTLSSCARALAHVHRHGLVHRDVKPANLLLRADGGVVLGDFGSACPIGTAAPRGEVVGTPLYASPEQSAGSPATPAADVYALGSLLHEWLTGRAPYGGVTLAEQAAQHAMAPIPTLPGDRARWQPLLDAMLAKNPASRLADGDSILGRIPS
jgi:serine/threonine-protein kinase PpkA